MKKKSVSGLFNEIGFSNKKKAEAKPNKRPEPNYSTRLVSKGVVSRKINYNSNNQITTIEETKGNVTTITDASGKLLQTITKNEGAKDTIKDYTILEDGTREESVFYGDNGAKDSSNPVYKNVYKNNQLVAKYEYDSNGQIIQRQNISDGTVVSVTKYNNGVEAETVQLFTNTNDYANPDKVFNNIIDPIKQDQTTTICWFLNSLSQLSKTQEGRLLIKDAATVDNATGSITITFKHAYGKTKEFTITNDDLQKAKKEKVKRYYFDNIPKGTVIYIDGKKECILSEALSHSFKDYKIKDNITFVKKNGEKLSFSKNQLDMNDSIIWYGPKYFAEDLTTLAFAIAAERSANEAGFSLGDGEGYPEEVFALLSDNIKSENFVNQKVYSETFDIKNNNTDSTIFNSDVEADLKHYEARKKLFEECVNYSEKAINPKQIREKLDLIKNNPKKYSNALQIRVYDGWHAAEILRFEEKNGKNYVVYSQPWDEEVEITEELGHFVDNTLISLSLIENGNNEHNISINSDSQIGSFQMGNKSNRTNFASAMAILGQNPNFKPDIQKEGENFVVTIKGEKIKITPNELETARVSGSYSTKDDDIPLLEIAVERYINKTRHNNTVYDLSHTNLEDVKIQDILNLFSDKELKPQHSRSLAEASKKDGLKFAIRQKYDESIGGMRNTYYPIKEIKQTPDGKYLISVIQPEDTSIVITYTEEEYRKVFNIIETCS